MQDRTINAALLALRLQTIREDRNGLEHVEALLRLRRVPMPEVTQARRKAFGRGELRRAMATLLRDGPKPRAALVAHVQSAHGFTPRRAGKMVDNTLGKMQRAGWVTRTDNLWALTSVNSALTSDGLVNDAATSSSPRQ